MADPAFWFGLLKQLGITIPVAVIAVWGFFKFFGGRLIDAKFDREKVEFQRHQNEELERLKMNINASLSRTAKLHQHEFEALPEAWRLLHTALGHGATVMSRGKRVVNVEAMTAPEFAEFLIKQDFTENQKSELKALQGEKRQANYERLKERSDLHRATVASADIHNYLLEKGIFIQPAIRAKMKAVVLDLNGAISERSMAFFNPTMIPVAWDKSDKVMKEYPAIMLELEAEVHDRLWDTNV